MKASAYYLMLGVLSAIFNCVLATALTSTVTLSDGVILGNPRDANGVLSFKGIPYSKPPIGDLRWHSPVPPTSWQGTLNATQFGYTCWNALLAVPITTQDEDCLTVNVWTAASDSNEKRPVMVWIYGGGFQFGGSSSPINSGAILAQEGVVIVSFNYRLGVIGFLGLEELDSEEEGKASGDFGLQDQLAALSWVKQNIANFGGDPDNITIFGESAGAHSVGLLMASPLSTRLFHRAIMESGAWWDRIHGPLTTFEEAREKGLEFEQKLGVSSVAGLRDLSAKVINNAQPFNINQDPGVTGFAPSVDGYVVPLVPGQAFRNGCQMKIPLLAGWNAKEEYLFEGNALPHTTAAQFESAAAVLFGYRMHQFRSFYPDNNAAILNASSDALVGDIYIREQTWEAAHTHQQTSQMPVFVYYYNYTSTYEPIASHTAEESFVFGTLVNNPAIKSFSPPTADDRAFSKQVMAYWTNFVKYGNPNSAGLPIWPAYGTGEADILELGNPTIPIDYDLDRFYFISSFRADGVLPYSWRKLNVSASGY